jgi:hypothetical protein
MQGRKIWEFYHELKDTVQKFKRVYIFEQEEEDFSDPTAIIIFDLIKILSIIIFGMLAWNF